MTRKTTKMEQSIVGAFCKVLYFVPAGQPVTLDFIQGALRGINPGVPSQQDYAIHLQVAIRYRYIKAVDGAKNTVHTPT